MFQLKDFRSITAGMINHMRGTQNQITDFNVGSVARTLIEAPAIEIDELYQQMFHGLKEAIPVSVFTSFGFDRMPAIGSSGLIRYSRLTPAPADILIPTGTVVSSPGGRYRYSTGDDAILHAGDKFVDVLSFCSGGGVATNTLAGTLTELMTPVAGIDSVTNINPFVNGADEENDDDRRIRFQGYVSTLPRGTVKSIEYGAMSATIKNANGEVIESVSQATVYEPYTTDPEYPIGLVECYIHNGSGVASPELVGLAKQIIDGYRLEDGTPVHGWKAAGIIVNVAAADEVVVDVQASLAFDPSTNHAVVRLAVTNAVRDYLLNLKVGRPAIRSEIIAIMMNIPGIYNVALTSPAGDVAANARGAKIMPGNIVLG
jgi:uncharacterized phage protein gp47/JayE